jgi:membrane peptidoglycan carboxypeptidase
MLTKRVVMTVGVPADEGGYPNLPTVPLPEPYAGDGAPQEPPEPSRRAARAARPRRLPRWLRRFLIVVMSLILVATVGFVTLLIVTPSVSNAPAMARAFDRAHHAAYPGPPVPARFAESLVATEDHRFYSEPGIDPYAVARVIRGRLTGGPDQGGATLYQQLAKMLYTSGRAGVAVEVEQVMLGIKLDLSYPKAEILRMYAAVAYFGHGYYGLSAASCGYFGVTPAGLNWPQAALLAGLMQAPTADNPLAHYAAARTRQAHVLSRLAATGKLTQAQASRAYAQPLHLVGGPSTGCSAHG